MTTADLRNSRDRSERDGFALLHQVLDRGKHTRSLLSGCRDSSIAQDLGRAIMRKVESLRCRRWWPIGV